MVQSNCYILAPSPNHLWPQTLCDPNTEFPHHKYHGVYWDSLVGMAFPNWGQGIAWFHGLLPTASQLASRRKYPLTVTSQEMQHCMTYLHHPEVMLSVASNVEGGGRVTLWFLGNMLCDVAPGSWNILPIHLPAFPTNIPGDPILA